MVAGDAGDVADDVDAAEGIDAFGHRSGDVGDVGDIEPASCDRPLEVVGEVGGLGEAIGVDVDREYGGALGARRMVVARPTPLAAPVRNAMRLVKRLIGGDGTGRPASERFGDEWRSPPTVPPMHEPRDLSARCGGSTRPPESPNWTARTSPPRSNSCRHSPIDSTPRGRRHPDASLVVARRSRRTHGREPHRRTEGPHQPALEVGIAGFFPYSPYVGTLNPIAPPIDFATVVVGDRAEVHATHTFETIMNGPPGGVHGGVVAGVFDELLGCTCVVNDVSGFTGHSPSVMPRSPARRADHHEGWVDRVEGRKTFATGTFHHGETLCATAEGIFIGPRTAT